MQRSEKQKLVEKLRRAADAQRRAYPGNIYHDGEAQGLDMAAGIIGKIRCEDAPSEEARRAGRWIRDECGELYCSECGRYTQDRHDMTSEFEGMKCIALVPPNYCGYCGAYMKGGEE